MHRRTLILVALIAVVGLSSLFWLRSNSVDLVHGVVLSTMLQKLPPDYPSERVESTFAAARREAESMGEQDRYLQALILVAQRLEKRHALKTIEVDEALKLLTDFRSLE